MANAAKKRKPVSAGISSLFMAKLSLVPVSFFIGGSGEIRTHGDIPASVLFKSTALNHSATLPIFARILAGLRK
jgi:hypothetical protein